MTEEQSFTGYNIIGCCGLTDVCLCGRMRCLDSVFVGLYRKLTGNDRRRNNRLEESVDGHTVPKSGVDSQSVGSSVLYSGFSLKCRKQVI